ncbi:MAG TPA: histidine kinase dimerization/phospho-acceptor domain-containing protein [Solirubrobacteraceae bacterium]|jgi:signal transduction histidine kinase|nr:histidine kinase dimerization/phospho-acceptor domain-containing protein [Solirubrobacteraceae bacterium]
MDRDVTDRIRLEQELREAKLQLVAASQANDRFLANVSHELRTPLNVILGFTGTVLMGLAGPVNEEQTKQLKVVQASGRRLLSLINDLLDVARIESGKIGLVVEAIDGRELLEDVASGLRPLADEKGIDLVVLAPPGLEVSGDRRAVRQILVNLASHAIDRTDEGEVRMALEHGAATRFSVLDTGSRIRPGDHEGLGLRTCRTLADRMGATLAFESEAGAGSGFVLELPHHGER